MGLGLDSLISIPANLVNFNWTGKAAPQVGQEL